MRTMQRTKQRYLSSARVLLLLVVLCLGCAGAPMEQAGKSAGEDRADKPKAQKVRRMIIYTGRMELIVDDLDQVGKKLKELLEQYEGYAASWEVSGTPGRPRTGHWTLRVPAERFEDFMNEVAQLGELRHRKVDSEDITDSYYDLQARIKNNEKEKEALQQLLAKHSGSLKDIIAVRSKIKEIQNELDQQKGQSERWKKLTDLATLHLTLHDRKDYVPPSDPTFGLRMGRTFWSSCEALLAFGEGLVLVAVALVPWIAVLLVPTLPLLGWAYFRQRNRRSSPDGKPHREL